MPRCRNRGRHTRRRSGSRWSGWFRPDARRESGPRGRSPRSRIHGREGVDNRHSGTVAVMNGVADAGLRHAEQPRSTGGFRARARGPSRSVARPCRVRVRGWARRPRQPALPRRAARQAAPTYAAVCQQVRGSAVVAPDETGWRVHAVRHARRRRRTRVRRAGRRNPHPRSQREPPPLIRTATGSPRSRPASGRARCPGAVAGVDGREVPAAAAVPAGRSATALDALEAGRSYALAGP